MSAEAPPVRIGIGLRSARAAEALVILVFTVAATVVSVTGVNPADEAWFLQVVSRVSSGETLYRDVFFGATPLSVYATLPLVALLGAEIAAVKLVVVVCFAATLVLAGRIARQLDLGRPEIALLFAAILVWAPPHHIGPYQQLGTAFLLLCLSATLAWRTRVVGRTGIGLAVLAGLAAALAFGAKQNVGAYALGALLAALAIAAPTGTAVRHRLGAVAGATAGFAVGMTAFLAPILATDAFDRFFEYAFANKGTYAEAGGISYADGISQQIEVVRATSIRLSQIVSLYELAAFFIVVLALTGLALAWARSELEGRREALTITLFAAAAVAAIFPRADSLHVSFTAPVVLVASAYCLHTLTRSLGDPSRRLAGVAVALVLMLGLAGRVGGPLLETLQGDYRPAALPHLRGALTDPAWEAPRLATARALAEEGGRGPLFVAVPDAGFHYLVSGLDNPTPFDYPLVSAFGRTGERELVEQIRTGQIEAVCLSFEGVGTLTPRLLNSFVQTRMRAVRDAGACTIYRRY